MFRVLHSIATKFGPLLAPKVSGPPIVTRGHKSWMRNYYISLHKRRLDQGPEPERPRSVWANWNYDAEIYAFGKRLGEEFNAATLKRAFVTSSYVAKEIEQRSALGLESDESHVELEDNEDLMRLGESTAEQYITHYLKHCFPLIPDNGIRSISSHLMSADVLGRVAANIGIKDLIQTAEFPVLAETQVVVLKAVIGALRHDQGKHQAELFVQDFIITQLIGKDILDLCSINNAMGLLVDVLQQLGQPEPEPRLLWSTGSNTILSTYIVGIYCNRQLVGQAPGETVTIAEEMAARDALRRFFNITDRRAPLPFGQVGHKLQLADSEQQ